MAIELEGFQLILLRRPDGASDYDEETLARGGRPGGHSRVGGYLG